MESLIKFIVWFGCALITIGSISIGFFLLFSPYDELSVRYQNYKLSSTGRPLKDEHFKNMDTIVFTFRICGCLLIAFAIAIGCLVFFMISKKYEISN